MALPRATAAFGAGATAGVARPLITAVGTTGRAAVAVAGLTVAFGGVGDAAGLTVAAGGEGVVVALTGTGVGEGVVVAGAAPVGEPAPVGVGAAVGASVGAPVGATVALDADRSAGAGVDEPADGAAAWRGPAADPLAQPASRAANMKAAGQEKVMAIHRRATRMGLISLAPFGFAD